MKRVRKTNQLSEIKGVRKDNAVVFRFIGCTGLKSGMGHYPTNNRAMRLIEPRGNVASHTFATVPHILHSSYELLKLVDGNGRRILFALANDSYLRACR